MTTAAERALARPHALNPPDDPELSRVFAGTVRRLAALHHGGAIMDDLVASRLARSYVHVVIRERDEAAFSVLLNSAAGVVACAPGVLTERHGYVSQFCDYPRRREAAGREFSYVGLTLFDEADLATPMAELDLSALDKGELADVTYWKPERAADVLFNHYD